MWRTGTRGQRVGLMAPAPCGLSALIVALGFALISARCKSALKRCEESRLTKASTFGSENFCGRSESGDAQGLR